MMEQAHDPEQQTAERYFLGELDDAQAEAFEAHYFECASCAEYVRETQMLLEGGRQVVHDKNDAARKEAEQKEAARKEAEQKLAGASVVHINERRRWPLWVSNAVAATLAVVLFMPPRPTSDIVHPQTLEMSASRAETAPPAQFSVGTPISVDFHVPPPDEGFARYELFTRNTGTGREIERHELTQEALNNNISLALDHLPVGRYEVVIVGVREDGKRSTIDTSPFEVRGQQQGESQ